MSVCPYLYKLYRISQILQDVTDIVKRIVLDVGHLGRLTVESKSDDLRKVCEAVGRQTVQLVLVEVATTEHTVT